MKNDGKWQGVMGKMIRDDKENFLSIFQYWQKCQQYCQNTLTQFQH
jgi:hypothetical protein